METTSRQHCLAIHFLFFLLKKHLALTFFSLSHPPPAPSPFFIPCIPRGSPNIPEPVSTSEPTSSTCAKQVNRYLHRSAGGQEDIQPGCKELLNQNHSVMGSVAFRDTSEVMCFLPYAAKSRL